MDSFSVEIQAEGFGGGHEMGWRIVRSWKSFKKLFEEAIHVDAVTYCASPGLLKELLTTKETELGSLNVGIGNKGGEDYRKCIDDENLVESWGRSTQDTNLYA